MGFESARPKGGHGRVISFGVCVFLEEGCMAEDEDGDPLESGTRDSGRQQDNSETTANGRNRYR